MRCTDAVEWWSRARKDGLSRSTRLHYLIRERLHVKWYKAAMFEARERNFATHPDFFSVEVAEGVTVRISCETFCFVLAHCFL